MAPVVHRWPGDVPAPSAEKLLLVAVTTPATTKRDLARQQVRTVLRTLLAPRLGCCPAAVPLVTLPGQPPYVAGRPDLGLSISHEAGLSLLALHTAGAVGIDLLAVDDCPAWADEIDVLARDYLGQRLAGGNAAQRRQRFALAWTAHEAQLKCLGLPLAESTPAQQQALARCRVQPLTVAAGFVASVATLV